MLHYTFADTAAVNRDNVDASSTKPPNTLSVYNWKTSMTVPTWKHLPNCSTLEVKVKIC